MCNGDLGEGNINDGNDITYDLIIVVPMKANIEVYLLHSGGNFLSVLFGIRQLTMICLSMIAIIIILSP